jgi:hypothetical protein
MIFQNSEATEIEPRVFAHSMMIIIPLSVSMEQEGFTNVFLVVQEGTSTILFENIPNWREKRCRFIVPSNW